MPLTLPQLTLSDIEGELDVLADNVRGAAIIDMANADYAMTAEESLASNLFVVNPGDGTKTLTVSDSANNPNRYSIAISGSGTISFAGPSSTLPVFNTATFLYQYQLGPIIADSSLCIYSSSTQTTSVDNTNEQILEQIYLPKNTMYSNGDRIALEIAVTKSGTAQTNTIRIRVGSAGTTSDTAIWSSASLAAAADNLATYVGFMRTAATTIKGTTAANAAAPWQAPAATFTTATVGNLESAGNYITITSQATAPGETVTLEAVTVNLSRSFA